MFQISKRGEDEEKHGYCLICTYVHAIAFSLISGVWPGERESSTVEDETHLRLPEDFGPDSGKKSTKADVRCR